MRLYWQHHLDVRSVVIFLRPAPTVPQPPFVINGLGRRSLAFDFDCIRLWELPAEQILETDQYGLWPLAGLMGTPTLDSTLAIAQRIATTPLASQERSELTGALVLLAGMRIPTQELAGALRRRLMGTDLWNESNLKEALEIIAREDTMREDAQLALEGRLGPLSADIVSAMAEATEPTLREVLVHSGTDTLEQLGERLGLKPTSE